MEKEDVNKQVELIYEDEMCDPQTAITAYRSLRLKGVNVIIGAFCSPSTLAIAPLAEQDKVILITPASSAETISQAGDYIFRNHVFSSQRGIKLGEFAANKFDSIATIYDKSNDAFVLTEKSLVEKIQEKNKIVLERQGVLGTATDFKTELIKIKASKPSAIYIGTLMPISALIVKQMKELNMTAQIIADDATVIDKNFLDAIGNMSEEIFFVSSDFDQETNLEFWNLYTERFGKNPTVFAAQSYNLMILANIISEKCKNGDSICVKEYLYQIKNYSGVSGSTTFDVNGDAVKSLIIKTIKNGQLTKVK